MHGSEGNFGIINAERIIYTCKKVSTEDIGIHSIVFDFKHFCNCMIFQSTSDAYILCYTIFFNIMPILFIIILYSAIIFEARQVAKKYEAASTVSIAFVSKSLESQKVDAHRGTNSSVKGLKKYNTEVKKQKNTYQTIIMTTWRRSSTLPYTNP